MKQSILAMLSELISAMRDESRKYHSLIVPLVSSSVEAKSATRVYLLEEAMDLWVVILQQTLYPCPPQILALAQHLFPMLDSASDTLRKAIEITEQYIYLAPHEMLGSTEIILSPFAAQLDSLKRETVGDVLNIADLLVRSALEIDGVKSLTTLTSHLLTSRFLQTLLSGLQGTFKHHQATGLNRNSTKATWVDILVETDYLTFLARYAIASPSFFLDVLKAGCPNERLIDTIAWLLPEWFSHLDNISHSEKKKLNCLALTALMQIGEPWIMNRLQELMTLWTELVLELYDEESKGDFLMYYDTETLKLEHESPAGERRRKVC